MKVSYRKNGTWQPIHLSLDLKKLDTMEELVKLKINELAINTFKFKKWKSIDIVDVSIISSTYNPTKETTFIDVLVFVAEING